MKRHLVSWMLLALLSVAVHALGGTECCVKVQLNVSETDLPNNRLGLKIRMTNTGSDTLRFSNGVGPWAGLRKIKLVAIRLPGGEPIDNQLRAIIDPELGPKEIAPKQSLEYDVPLDELYHELAVELRKGSGEFVLFWTYELVTLDERKSDRLGGWLMISAKKKS
jgi:hypothetical protein